MSISATLHDDRVADISVSDTALSVTLRDGRVITAPLSRFPRLQNAPAEHRATWEPAAGGHGIHWPLIDEDLSVEGLLHGASATES
jgi:hypothetical protein